MNRAAAALAGAALLLGAQGALAANRTPSAAADWRTPDPENLLLIDTSKGRIIVEMVPEAAPVHVAQIRRLVRARLYDGLVFFRVIDQFMAQTGDPKNTGDGGSSEPNLKAEFTFRRSADGTLTTVARPMGTQVGFVASLPVVSQADSFTSMTSDHKLAAWGTYCPGVAGMARDDEPDTANSQFFLMRQAYPSLDKRYTAWGRVLAGLDVVRAIKTGEPVADPDKMTRVRVLADLPEAERPGVQVIDTRSAAFRRLVARVRRARGADFSVCDIELQVRVR